MHSSVKQRIIIKYCTNENVEPSEICEKRKRQFVEETSDIIVYKWSKAFQNCRESVEDEPHLRRSQDYR